jgi:hypothetical protein
VSLDTRDERIAAALREEAYRLPVMLTVDELTARLELRRGGSRRNTAIGWLLSAIAAAALVVVAVTRPGVLPSVGATPEVSRTPCVPSPATLHGTWWSEVGGPNAFFNVEPGTLEATLGTERWLLIVRVAPGLDGRTPELTAENLETGRRVKGAFNSTLDPKNIFRQDEPAPSLPGAWNLFELPVPQSGCWRLAARGEDGEIGSAVVAVLPDPAATPRPATSLHIDAVASGCSSFGGCAYFATLIGSGPAQRAEFRVVPPAADATWPPPDGELPLAIFDLPDALAPDTYVLRFEGFWVSDAIANGQREMTRSSTCEIGFVVEDTTRSVDLHVEFTEERCDVIRR